MKIKTGLSTAQNMRLKELAAHLGLSQSTVSRVLNQAGDQYRIAPQTQKRILEAAEALNYAPNALAQQLRQKRSFTMGVMVPEISEGYAAAVLGGIEDVLLQENFFYFVVSHRHQPTLLQEYPRMLLARSVEGLIAIDTPLTEELPIPVVSVSGHQKLKGVVSIELDHLKAAHYALTHLVELGHRKIAFIKGQSFSSDTAPRWKSIQKVSAELGIYLDPKLVVQLEENLAGSEPGYRATLQLLSRKKDFTAIFSFNDVSAIGAITALHEHGLHVPRDISIVGFDDIPSATTIHPALTTVRQPLHNMGTIAATEALRLIQEKHKKSSGSMGFRSIPVTPLFIPRKSSGPVSPRLQNKK